MEDGLNVKRLEGKRLRGKHGDRKSLEANVWRENVRRGKGLEGISWEDDFGGSYAPNLLRSG